MKKYFILMGLCFGLSSGVFAQQKPTENDYTGLITVCFNALDLGNTRGEIDIKRNAEAIIETPFVWLNEIAATYQISDMIRKYQVKDQAWQYKGQYPMNVFSLTVGNKFRYNSQKMDELVELLSSLPQVLFAEREVHHRVVYTPNDPRAAEQWALEKIQAYEAWDLEAGGDDALVIGIVDSGVKWNHPDLQDNIWINEAELPGITIDWESGTITGGDGIDNDGNGFIDDVLGWDFYSTGSGGQDNNPFQNLRGSTHGTHVAGCAAAIGDNGIGVVGPAYKVKILITKHAGYNYLDYNGYVYNTYAGVYYMVDTGAMIINASWGGPGNAGEANLAGSYAKEHGALFIAAAGNNGVDSAGTIFYPGGSPFVFGVVATQQNDVRSSFSNYGTAYNISAPGSNILSTVFSQSGNNTYAAYDGTSMASPIVTGVAALVKSRNINMTPDELMQYLVDGADPIDQLNAPNMAGKLGAGRLNAFNSVSLVPIIENDLAIIAFRGPGSLIQNTSREYVLIIKNNGVNSAFDYTVRLMLETNTYPFVISTLPGVYTPSHATHNFIFSYLPDSVNNTKLYAEILWENDENYDNNYSDPLDIVVYQEDSTEIYVGNLNSDSASNQAFINYNFADCITQTIYWENELTIGSIQGMSVQFTGVPTLPGTGIPIRIYLATTNETAFVNNISWIPLDQFALVFQRELYVSGAGNYEVNIPFAVPYDYRGGNLVVMAIKDYNTGYGEDNAFQFTETTNQYRTIFWRSSAIGSPNTNPFPAAINRLAGITNAKFVLAPPFYTPPVNLEATLDSNEVKLTWDLFHDRKKNRELTGFQIYKNDERIAENIINFFYIDSSIINDTSYAYYIQAVYESPNGVSTPSNTATIHTMFPPANLSSSSEGINVVLHWLAPEGGNVLGYMIQRDEILLTSVPITTLSYTDYSTEADTEYIYHVSVVYSLGESAPATITIHTPVPEIENTSLPRKTELQGNYPNPFNPETQIKFSLHHETEVQINIYNIKGQLVKTLVHKTYPAGNYLVLWNGTDEQGRKVSSGIYYYQMLSQEYTALKKMVLLK